MSKQLTMYQDDIDNLQEGDGPLVYAGRERPTRIPDSGRSCGLTLDVTRNGNLVCIRATWQNGPDDDQFVVGRDFTSRQYAAEWIDAHILDARRVKQAFSGNANDGKE